MGAFRFGDVGGEEFLKLIYRHYNTRPGLVHQIEAKLMQAEASFPAENLSDDLLVFLREMRCQNVRKRFQGLFVRHQWVQVQPLFAVW